MIAGLLTVLARLLSGVHTRWLGCGPTRGGRVYFSNHTSHLDFLVIWSSLPPELRRRTRPVAAGDYWGKGLLRRYLARNVFNAVLIDRNRISRDLIGRLAEVLESGDSLIIFPEGTRNVNGGILPFKSGLFHLARRCPDVEFVPVYLENLDRILPKGEIVPIPLSSSATFGCPIRLQGGEKRERFLERSRLSLETLREKQTAA